MKKSMAARLGTLLAAIAVVCSASSIFAADSIWFDDGLPLGATPTVSGGDAWHWITSSPTAESGVRSHQSNLVAGLHEHSFASASATMAVNSGDTLVTYVYIDPSNVPSEIMLSWNNGSWEHRAYWGSNSILYGTSGSAGRYYMGVMPAAGQWVRLQIPASAVGLAGSTVSGMSFSLYGGRAAFDASGKFAAAATGGTTTGTSGSSGTTSTTGSTGTSGSTGSTTSTGTTSTTGTTTTGGTTSTSGTSTTGSTTSTTSTGSTTGTSSGSTTSTTGSTSTGTTTAATADVVSVVATSPTASLDGTQLGMLTFTRTGDTSADLAVNFNLAGTAAKWTDYYRLPQGDMPSSVTIPAGSTSTTLSITGRANSTGANPETAIFTLASGTGYTVGSAAAATLTLGAAVVPVIPTLSIAATNATASLDGNQTGLIIFTRTGSTTSAVTVNFNLGGTAAKWTDYYRLPQGDMPSSVTIAAGATTATLPITARANSTNASPETVVVALTAPSDTSLTIGTPSSVTLNIVATAAASTGTSTTSTGSTTTTGTTTTGTTGTTSTGTTSTGTTTTTSTGSTTSTPPPATVGTTTTTPITVAGADSVATRTSDSIVSGNYVDDTDLQLPKVGSNLLRVLSPTTLELISITTKQPDPAPATNWNFVNSSGAAALPAGSKFTVTVGGQPVSVTAVGFKRRVLYAPLNSYDLRIQNSLYLQINASVSDNQLVTVTNSDGTLWSSSTQYEALTTPQRYSPAIHVNQEGYVPAFAKQAQVGYYLGDMGEMPIPSSNGFKVVDAVTGNTVFTGTLSLRQDTGYTTSPLPYQQVYIADFSSFQTPGQYQIEVPGMGASLPFLIDDGIAMAWARTYSLGMYEQRSGMAVSLPFTRFTHAADHTAPALVPDTSSKFNFAWTTIAGYATTVNSSNPAQTAAFLTSNANSLYPYNRTGSVDVSGGHFDAGDYSKYTINSAQLTHELIFAVDNIPGIKTYDNLGIPESGDGIPDALQEAKWEADYIAKLQDTDGGFYFLTYPLNSEYESGVLPENGQTQVVWPKNTSASAAATAALAEAGSSPAMIKYYPAAAASYLAKAKAGWTFLTNAIAAHGKAGAYQKLTFYGDDWTHDDELAWAAAAMYAATGQSQYQTQLFAWFPNPADSSTFRWGWWNMSEGWGNAIRDYAFAARSGRLSSGALDANYLATCNAQVVSAGDNALSYTNACAYGTPFPPATKAVLGGGWYFSLDQASDMAIAYQVSPKQAYVDALVAAMNYEGGSNPVNVCYLEGLGMKRQQQTVSQYAQASRRVLSPTGNVIGQVTAGFEYLNQYGSTLTNLSYPSDSGTGVTFPYYDRWSDAYNVTTEQITVNNARSFISVGFLASLTSSAATAWVAPGATITVPTSTVALGSPVTLTVSVPNQSLTGARIVWEARDQMPAYGSTYTISPVNNGDQWVEVEIEWSDGRRAFGTADFQANSTSQIWIDDALPANATTGSDGGDKWNWVSSSPAPHSGSASFQSINASGEHDVSFMGSTGSMDDDESTIGQQGSMAVSAGDNLTAWVYLNPSSMPTEIMLCWYDGSSYEHRAYWGANQISWGTNNTPGCYNAGALPAGGGWVKISVPASAVNLADATVSGMTFAAYGGQVAWDAIGRN